MFKGLRVSVIDKLLRLLKGKTIDLIHDNKSLKCYLPCTILSPTLRDIPPIVMTQDIEATLGAVLLGSAIGAM